MVYLGFNICVFGLEVSLQNYLLRNYCKEMLIFLSSSKFGVECFGMDFLI